MKIESTEKGVIPVLDTGIHLRKPLFKKAIYGNSVAAPIGLGNVVSTTAYNTATLSTDITFKKLIIGSSPIMTKLRESNPIYINFQQSKT